MVGRSLLSFHRNLIYYKKYKDFFYTFGSYQLTPALLELLLVLPREPPTDSPVHKKVMLIVIPISS